MARWRAHISRNPAHRVWIEVPRIERQALSRQLVMQAMAAGALIRDANPEPGWISNAHSRDGKDYPCKEQTHGARPAWIWTGDTED